jgi:hypothetical protein
MPASHSWVFPYVEEPHSKPRHPDGSPVLRPALEVALVGPAGEYQSVLALVDSGCEHTLAAPFLMRAIQADPDPNRELYLGIGGGSRQIRFTDVLLRLGPPGTSAEESEEWQAEIGFFTSWEPPWPVILGQIGFFDHFTVTMNRYSQALAVEPFDEFDKRFQVQMRESEDRRRRFRP